MSRASRAPIASRTAPLPYTFVNRYGEFQIYKRVNGLPTQIGTADTQSRAEEIVNALNLVAQMDEQRSAA